MADLEWPPFSRPDLHKAKAIVCAIIESSGGAFHGKTRLNKVFWWAHVKYQRDFGIRLSQYPIARLPEGPCIDAADSLLMELAKDRAIDIQVLPKGPYFEHTFQFNDGHVWALSDDERSVIAEAVQWAGTKSATAISQESHRLSRAWQESSNGEIIDTSIDCLSDDDLEDFGKKVDQLIQSVDARRPTVERIFGGQQSS
ncbi:MAG: hypothetical protein AAF916_00080 [Planctomycetota bacterium]